MKKNLLITVIFMFAFLPLTVFGFHTCPNEDEKKQEKDKGIARCPKTTMTDQKQCLDCHVKPTFKVREARQHLGRNYPNDSTKIKGEGDKQIGHYFMMTISPDDLQESIEYFKHHAINHIVIEVHSPGGGLFDAWRCIGIMSHWEAKGMVIETRVYGFAASAGFLIFCGGTKGHRLISPTAECMWHELRIGEFMKITTPSGSEDEAEILRHLQNTAQNWIVNRSRTTKDDLDKRIRKKDWWLNGTEMVELGLADGYLG